MESDGSDDGFEMVFYAFECLRDDLKINDLPPCAPSDFVHACVRRRATCPLAT